MYISINLSTEKAIGVPMIFLAIRIEVENYNCKLGY